MNKRIKNIIRMSVFVSLFMVLTFISPVLAVNVGDSCDKSDGTPYCENAKLFECYNKVWEDGGPCETGMCTPDYVKCANEEELEAIRNGTYRFQEGYCNFSDGTESCVDGELWQCNDEKWKYIKDCESGKCESDNSKCLILPESIGILYYGGNSVVPDSLSMSSDESLFVKVIVRPDNASNKKVHWISNNYSPVVTVSEYNGDFGSGFVLKASKQSGEITFFAIADGNNNVNKSIKIKVSSEVRDVEQQSNNTSIKEITSTPEVKNTSSIIPSYPTDSEGNTFIFADKDVASIFNALLPYIYVFAGIILLFMLIAGGFGLMTAAGDPKKIEASQKKITSGIVGFILIFISYFVAQIVELVLGIKIL